MINLPQPETQMQEVLHALLYFNSINTYQLISRYYILNPTARISDLRLDYGLDIRCIKLERHNKWGRKIMVGQFRLIDKDKGLEVYRKMHKQE